MILRKPLRTGSSLMGVLLAITLFALISLVVIQWQNYQQHQILEIYQRTQALQIAENQKQRLVLALDCETAIQQNDLSFKVECNKATQAVNVQYPLGKIILKNP